MTTFTTSSSAETKKFAEGFARKTLRAKRRSRGALVLALYGNLGSGKTTFVQGFFRGLGIRRRVASPTFILFRRAPMRDGHYQNAYHVDAYRLKSSKELSSLGFRSILSDSKNIVLIEWADKVARALPRNAIAVRFSYGKSAHTRTIKTT